MKKIFILILGMVVAAGLNAQCNFLIQSSGTNNCAGVTLTVMPTNGTPSSYAWTGPGGFTATTNPITALVNGNYAVTVTFVGGCTKVGSVSLSIPAPNVVMDSLAFCGNGTAKATVTQFGGTSTTFNWSNGFNETKTGSLPRTSTNSGLAPGLYSVTITANPSGCSTVRSVNIATLPAPTAAISGNLFYCEGSTTILTASGGNAYTWSNGSTNAAITVSTPNLYTVTVTGANGCTDAETVLVQELSTSSSTTNTTICADELPYTWNGLTFTGGGSQTATLTGANGCDSLATLVLTVNPIATSTTNTTICADELPYTWNGLTFTGSGSQTATLTGANGCDSLATLVLTVNPIATSTTNTTICADELPYTWNGLTFTGSGSQTATLTGANGCDSLATLVLTVNPIATSTTNTTICVDELPYTWNGLTFTGSGSQTATLTGANGCDSLATLVLTVNPIATSTTNTTICADELPYTWNGLTFTGSGSQTATLTGANGCDSLATLVLTVNPIATSTTNTTICADELPYTWNGLTFTGGGSQTATLTGANGCDSLATLVLTVNLLPIASIEADSLACGSTTTLTATGGTSYEWNTGSNDQTISAPVGSYSVTVTSGSGCSNTATILVGTLPTCVYTCVPLFPNPIMVGSVLTIETNEILSSYPATVTNFLGQVVWSGTISGTPGGSGTQFLWTIPTGFAAGGYNIETPCFQVATFIVVN